MTHLNQNWDFDIRLTIGSTDWHEQVGIWFEPPVVELKMYGFYLQDSFFIHLASVGVHNNDGPTEELNDASKKTKKEQANENEE